MKVKRNPIIKSSKIIAVVTLTLWFVNIWWKNQLLMPFIGFGLGWTCGVVVDLKEEDWYE